MNRTLWKLDRIGERLWTLARLTAIQAAALANDGKGLAVVAEETRGMADKVNEVVERVTFDDADINKEHIVTFALQLNLLALNSAIESFRLGHLGKQAAVCAEDIRNLAHEIVCLFDKETADKAKQFIHPWPKYPLTSINKCEYLHLDIGGIQILENLDNVKEVCAYMERKDGVVKLRGMELPLVDCYKMIGETQQQPICVIIQTPGAEQNKTYAVTAEVKGIHLSRVGRHMVAPSDMPLAKCVRECWENENGEPFYLMNWTKMVNSRNE
jgi:chemotaxis signal transduction protein